MTNDKLCDYLLLPFVEIEVRLGTNTNNKFDNSVDLKYFDSIKKVVETGDWKSIEHIQTKEQLNKNLRLITNLKDSKKSLIMKENVINKLYQLNNSPFDIKLSINQEFSLNSYINSFENVKITRKKNITSYISDNFKY